jgi:hypothetical protein
VHDADAQGGAVVGAGFAGAFDFGGGCHFEDWFGVWGCGGGSGEW